VRVRSDGHCPHAYRRPAGLNLRLYDALRATVPTSVGDTVPSHRCPLGACHRRHGRGSDSKVESPKMSGQFNGVSYQKTTVKTTGRHAAGPDPYNKTLVRYNHSTASHVENVRQYVALLQKVCRRRTVWLTTSAGRSGTGERPPGTATAT